MAKYSKRRIAEIKVIIQEEKKQEYDLLCVAIDHIKGDKPIAELYKNELLKYLFKNKESIERERTYRLNQLQERIDLSLGKIPIKYFFDNYNYLEVKVMNFLRTFMQIYPDKKYMSDIKKNDLINTRGYGPKSWDNLQFALSKVQYYDDGSVVSLMK